MLILIFIINLKYQIPINQKDWADKTVGFDPNNEPTKSIFEYKQDQLIPNEDFVYNKYTKWYGFTVINCTIDSISKTNNVTVITSPEISSFIFGIKCTKFIGYCFSSYDSYETLFPNIQPEISITNKITKHITCLIKNVNSIPNSDIMGIYFYHFMYPS